jgi:dienelactone hydrolase
VIVIHEIFGLSDWVRLVADSLAAAGKAYTTTVYPGTGHGFLRTGEPADVAAGAWRDVVGFLAKELGK